MVAAFVAYANSLSTPFFFDDHVTIADNAHIRDLGRLIASPFPDEELPVSGRPLVHLTFAVNYALHGTEVVGYHLVNLVIHVLAALAAFGLLRRTFELASVRDRLPHSLGVAFAIALLWTVHPLNTEAVTYITQRTESMMGLFFLVTMYCGVRALHSRRPAAWHGAAVAASALGMACKETMAVVPIVMVAFDRAVAFPSFGDALKSRRWLYAGLAASWGVLGALMLSAPAYRSIGFATDVGVWTYLLNQTTMIVRYLRLAFWPDALVVVYGWPRALSLTDVLPEALFVCSLLAATAVALIRWPPAGFIGAWFFVTLAPASSFIPIATEVGAERRMYLPLLSVITAAVVLVAVVWQRWPRAEAGGVAAVREPGWRSRLAAFGTLAVIAGALTSATVARNREYASPIGLAQTVLARWPTGFASHLLAEELIVQGRQDEAISHLRQAVGDAPRAHYQLGVVLFNRGELDAAVQQMREFISRQPAALQVIDAHVTIGHAYMRQGRSKEAADEAREALRKVPSHANARELLGQALFEQGLYADAAAELGSYITLQPNDTDALVKLGVSLVAMERLEEAARVFRRAVEVDPKNGQARKSLALALLDTGASTEALPHAAEAVALLAEDASAHVILGRALLLGGATSRARYHLQQALRLDPQDSEARELLAAADRRP